MRQDLRKAILAVMGVGTMAGISTQANATGISADITGTMAAGFNVGIANGSALPYVWDGSNINCVPTPNCVGPMGTGTIYNDLNSSNSPVLDPNYAAGQPNDPASFGNDTAKLGWNHNMSYRVFNIATSGGYKITFDRNGGAASWNPAFTVWSSGTKPWANTWGTHSFNQVTGPDPTAMTRLLAGGYSHQYHDAAIPAGPNGDFSYAADGSNSNDGMAHSANPVINNGIQEIVGYANAGGAFTNGDGNAVLGWKGTGNTTAGSLNTAYNGTGASVATSNGHSELNLWLPAGWYAIAAGGSCPDLICTVSNKNGNARLQIVGNSSVTAPAAVPVPAAVWLFGSALAGMGVIGRRRQTAAA